MISRRAVLRGLGAAIASGAAVVGYGVAGAAGRVHVAGYHLSPPGWPASLPLRIAALADIHACEPWMPPQRIADIVAQTNALEPDLIVLLGDYMTRHRLLWTPVPETDLARELGRLKAPLGVLAVQGNHDMWNDRQFQQRRHGLTGVRRALEGVGIPVLDNDAVRLVKDGQPFWIAGLADQWAFYAPRDKKARPRTFGYLGIDDLPGTLAKLTDDAPAILLAHEPDIFPKVPTRFSLTMSGHMHHGQVRLLGYAPIVPSAYGRRYLHGHIVEDGRHLVVSGGLGCSGLPVRIDAPPEIVLVEIGRKVVA